MAINALFIMDPLEKLDTKTDTTLALADECARRGYKNYFCTLEKIFLENGKCSFIASQLDYCEESGKNPKVLGREKKLSIDHFDVVFMRKDPPVNEQFISALFMLKCFDPKKTLMFNDPSALLLANEKVFGLEVANQFFPKTLISAEKSVLNFFISEHEKIVLKPLNGAGGSGVLLFDRNDKNINSSLEILTESFKTPIVAQEFIKNSQEGDKRILLLGGKALGAILRKASGQDFRANFHAGGVAHETKISKAEEKIISHLAPKLNELGLHFVGIDVIGDQLTEINVTSPTCMIEMESSQKLGVQKKLREQVWDYIEKLIEKSQKA